LQAPRPCPRCGEYNLYRSHSKNILERAVKNILPLKTYRCHNCNWRGWLNKKRRQKKATLKSLLFYAAVAVAALIIAFLLRGVLM
jgi:predicted RNA-binding Zn-ribbon protein involved in translation (DUF1610 family)